MWILPVMEIATGDHGPHHLDNLVIKSENGKCQDWRRRQRDTLQMQSIEHISKYHAMKCLIM